MQAQENNLFVQALQHTLQGKGYPSDVQFRAKLAKVKHLHTLGNLAASSIVRFCQRAVATMGLPPDAWTVQVKPVIANAE